MRDFRSLCALPFLFSAMGIGIGLLIWRSLSFTGWSSDTLWARSLIVATLPILSLSWVCNLAIGILLKKSTTRSNQAYWLIMALILWLCIGLVFVGAYLSYGTAYTHWPSLIFDAACVGAAGSAFIIGLVRILRAIRSRSQAPG